MVSKWLLPMYYLHSVISIGAEAVEWIMAVLVMADQVRTLYSELQSLWELLASNSQVV
jgi:hypothetical protein